MKQVECLILIVRHESVPCHSCFDVSFDIYNLTLANIWSQSIGKFLCSDPLHTWQQDHQCFTISLMLRLIEIHEEQDVTLRFPVDIYQVYKIC